MMKMYPAAGAYPRSSTQMMSPPSHMKMDHLSSSPNPPVYPPCWPSYNNNATGDYSYPHGGCCNHSPTPSYYYGHAPATYTPCPPPPPPPFHPHPHGLLYYPFPAAAAAAVPPQHYYSVEQPRYDYYNNHHHCCGCNHLHHDDKRPRPNEESQSLHDNDEAKALLLKDRPADYQHPIMWLPQPKANGDDNKDKYSHQDPTKHPPRPSKQIGDIDGDANPPFPFRILWLPDQVGNDTKENNLDLVAKNRLLDHKTTSEINEAECETSSTKRAAQKVIPVKQLVTISEEKKNPKSTVNSGSEEKGGSRGASPKTETSKLPPVCLRIDPLPRKKKTSRSPSPPPPLPVEKQTSNVSNPKSSEHQAQVLKKSKEEQVEGDVKTVDHANKVQHYDVPTGKGHENEVEEKKNMSEDEAALIIQSAYRGFEVRKSQSLKKLNQINEVRKQVFELRNRIQDLEPSSTIRLDGKKKVIIGETIMSLLLKLDTIQGLHPFIREVRKSVAKELVGLQEKLDSLISVKSSETASKCSLQQVTHPEDDATQDMAQAQTDLCEYYQLKSTESQKNDNAQACNLERQWEKKSIQNKFDQAPAESDTIILENNQVEATESQEECNTIGELQLESHKENSHQMPTECDEAPSPRLCENNEVEAIESHKACNIVGEPQLDQAPTECDKALGLCENNEVRAAELQEDCNAIGEEPQLESHKDEAPTEGDEAQGLYDTHEVEAAEIIGEPQLESHRDQAPAEGDGAQRLCDTHKVKVVEKGRNVVGESQKEKLDEAATECDEGLGLCENHEVEATDSGGVEAHDMKLENDTGKVNKNHLEMRPVNAENMAYDCVADDKHVVESGDSVQMDNIRSADGGLMEDENLRAAVEELMKAGKEQLGVIRELTGRVKDLEKKLSKKTKKNKVKVNKGRRSREVVV